MARDRAKRCNEQAPKKRQTDKQRNDKRIVLIFDVFIVFAPSPLPLPPQKTRVRPEGQTLLLSK